MLLPSNSSAFTRLTNSREAITAGGQRPGIVSVPPDSLLGTLALNGLKRRVTPRRIREASGHTLALSRAVDCRIQVLQEGEVRVVRIAGSLSDAQVPDLLIACGQAAGPVRVDLTDVMTIDAIGVDALRRVRKAGAQLVGISKYLRLKLESRRSRHSS